MADRFTQNRRYFLPMPGGPGDDTQQAPKGVPLPPGAAQQIAEREQRMREAAEAEAPVEVESVAMVKTPASKDPFKPLAGSKTSASSAPRRMAPKVSAEVYAGWKDRVDDNEYSYARSPTGDEFVILRAPADKQNLVGAKLSPDIVAGSPRLQRSYDAIKATVEANLPAVQAWEDAAVKMQTPKPETMPGATSESAAAAGDSMNKAKSKRPPYAGVKDILKRSNLGGV
jgi:hypothetical protein